MAKKKIKGKTKRPAMALVKPKKKPAFTDLAKLSNEKREDTAGADARNMLLLACEVFEIPPQGITILGGQPYINKVGWKMKQAQFAKGSRVETKWVHLATPLEKWAIVEALFFGSDGKEIARAIGEAQPENIKLAAVKMTLNMMAETRAKNRVLYDALIANTFTGALKKMEAMKLAKDVQATVANAAKVTAEEINQPETAPAAKPLTSYAEKLKIALYGRGCKTEAEALKMIDALTGIHLARFDSVSEENAKEILFTLNS